MGLEFKLGAIWLSPDHGLVEVEGGLVNRKLVERFSPASG
jgi:hypothetical protein